MGENVSVKNEFMSMSQDGVNELVKIFSYETVEEVSKHCKSFLEHQRHLEAVRFFSKNPELDLSEF